MREIKLFLVSYRALILLITTVGIIIDVFLPSFGSDLFTICLITLWLLSIWLYHFSGRDSVKVSLILLVICPFLLAFGFPLVAEKAAVWAYIFLTVGVIGLLMESKNLRR